MDKEDSMASHIPVPDPVTSVWLTAVLRAAGQLTEGEVLGVAAMETGAFNSHTRRLKLEYSQSATSELPTSLILKRNTQEPWAIEAGAEEVKFYQVAASLRPSPPALPPCYAAAYD